MTPERMTPAIDIEARRTVDNLVQHCLTSGEDPMVYAARSGINLKDPGIQLSLADWSHTINGTDEEVQKRYRLLYRIASDVTACCDDSCKFAGGILCPRKSIRKLLNVEDSFSAKINLLLQNMDVIKQDAWRRKNLAVFLIRELVHSASTEQELNVLLEKVREIKEKFLQDVKGLGRIKEALLGNPPEDHINEVFNEHEREILNKIESLKTG